MNPNIKKQVHFSILEKKMSVMKGYIFTEFLEMVEEQFGLIMMDKIIMATQLESEGVYTSVGSYNQKELFQLINNLSNELNEETKTIMKITGERLYNTYINSFNKRLLSLEFQFSFIERLENYLRDETRKIFNNKEIFNTELVPSENALIITFECNESEVVSLIEGIINGCISASGESVHVKSENVIFNNNLTTRLTIQQ